MRERPNMQAIMSGVRPLWSVASTGTPAPSSTSTTATWPFRLAQWMGRGPCPLSEWRSARPAPRLSTMKRATDTWPFSAIQCAAEWPY